MLRDYLLLFFSILFALMLTVLPLPGWTVWFRPIWIFLVIFYWVIYFPGYCGALVVWFSGLLVDALNGTLLGEHAFALILVSYLVSKLYQRVRLYPVFQQMMCIMLFSFIYLSIIFIIQGAIGRLPNSWLFWMPILTSALFWPWVFFVLNEIHQFRHKRKRLV